MRFSVVIKIQTQDYSYMMTHYLRQKLPFPIKYIDGDRGIITIKAQDIKASSQNEILTIIEETINKVLDNYAAKVYLLRTDLEAYIKFNLRQNKL